jgi:hypothetical protein
VLGTFPAWLPPLSFSFRNTSSEQTRQTHCMPKLLPRLLLIVGSLMPATLLLARSDRRAPDPPSHRHDWRPSRPPDGFMRLVDEHGGTLESLRPGQVARIEVIGLPNVDQCIAPECSFGSTGIAVEAIGPRAVRYADGGAGGRFGRRGADGRFVALRPDDVGRITHYRAPLAAGTVRLIARFDDAGRPPDAEGGWIRTFNDPPADGRPYYYVVAEKSPAPRKSARRLGREP